MIDPRPGGRHLVNRRRHVNQTLFHLEYTWAKKQVLERQYVTRGESPI